MSIQSLAEENPNQVPLLEAKRAELNEEESLGHRVLVESKKLWSIFGPTICGRIASYSMLVVSQAFAGHLGDLKLAGLSIATTVISGFDFDLLLAMASALETLYGQAFGGKNIT